MNDLALKVRETTPYFVRCVKPNGVKKPRVFENVDVSHQLRCAGVLEAIRIMRDMYPSRLLFIIDFLIYSSKFMNSY